MIILNNEIKVKNGYIKKKRQKNIDSLCKREYCLSLNFGIDWDVFKSSFTNFLLKFRSSLLY